MAIEKISAERRTFAFSYAEMGEQGFSLQFSQDYLEQQDVVSKIADVSDELIDQVNTNTDDITQNKADIAQNKQDIQDNKNRLDTVEPIVANNVSRLDLLEPRVDQNELDIDQNATNFTNHNSSTSEHGVTGNNVGTGDYCTLVIGGVVDLAALVADLTQITTADILPAPAAYDQTYTQTVTDLTNENKAKINEIVDKVNGILAGQIAAKQMSAV